MTSNYENYFWKINSVADFLEAERQGYPATYKSTSPEMPGATLLHQAVRKCELELLQFLVNERGLSLHALDDDLCTPFGYAANEELVYYLLESPEYFATVNLGCDQPEQIKATVTYLFGLGAPCIYCEVVYDQKWLQTYLNEVEKLIQKR